MKYLAYLRFSIKSLLATWKQTLIVLIGMPIVLSLFLGMAYSTGYGSGTIEKKFTVSIEDNDKTDASNMMIDFLKSDSLKKNINVVDKEDSDLNIIIPKGYEDALSEFNDVKVLVDEDGDYVNRNLIESVLKSYHENLYISKYNLSEDDLQELQKESVELDLIKSEKIDYYMENALSGLSFSVSILIMSFIIGSYSPIAKNISKKTALAPISRSSHFALDYYLNCITVIVILWLYILIYNLMGLAFDGIVFKSLFMLIPTAIFTTSIATFIISFFKEKYGKLIAHFMMMMPLLFQVLLPQMTGKNLNYLSIVYVVSEGFNELIDGKILSVEILIMTAIGIILYFIAKAKAEYDWRVGK